MKKSTLICMHILPIEIEMFDRFIGNYKNSLQYLDIDDNVTFRFTLNLNPELTDWSKTKLPQSYFIDIFNKHFTDISNINEVITDTSMRGTTQQKRDSYKLEYDQFIFCDADIGVHPHLLKLQLLASYDLNDMYVISPSIPRWWDTTWDIIVDSRFKGSELGTYKYKDTYDGVFTQNTDDVIVKLLNEFKYGCGMHTLYSKSFWKFITIPESFGGYGPEDTLSMYAARHARSRGYPIYQYVMDGIYITEDYHNRVPSINDLIHPINRKDEFYKKAWSTFNTELSLFIKRI
jgi:hypothetical protein